MFALLVLFWETLSAAKERQALKDYIDKVLAAGLICSFSSPVGEGFFFVDKKDGSLRLCIDYRGLNDMTVRDSYPLPLLSSVFELLLLEARVFTKLDLCNVHHLVCIR